jgi:hypothetical protein
MPSTQRSLQKSYPRERKSALYEQHKTSVGKATSLSSRKQSKMKVFIPESEQTTEEQSGKQTRKARGS